MHAPLKITSVRPLKMVRQAALRAGLPLGFPMATTHMLPSVLGQMPASWTLANKVPMCGDNPQGP